MNAHEGSAEHEFEVLSTETKYSGAITALRVDKVAMPGGGSASREVVEHFGAVVIVAVDDDDRLVFIRQYRHPLGRRLWELPAGLLDNAGEDPVDAARRELLEETGLEAGSWSTLVDLATSPGFTDEVLRIYLARELSEVGRPPGEDEEAELTTARVAVSDAVRRVLAGEIVNASAVAGILALAAVRAGDATPRPADAPWQVESTAFAQRRAAAGRGSA